MKVHSIAITISLLISATAAYAADVPTQAASPASGTTSRTSAASATTTPASTTKTVADPETAKAAHAMGLTQKIHNAQIVWCKVDTPLGTKLASYNCLRNEQVAAAARRSAEDKDSLDRIERNNLSEPQPIEPATALPAPH